jgi:hypothetical protein
MKIDNQIRSFASRKTLDTPAHQSVHNKPFQDFMGQQEREHSEEQLRKSLQQIIMQGERLTKSMTVRELHAYKSMLRRFLEDTVRRGIGIKETRGWDRRGRGKKYKLLDEIDQHLVSLAEELLSHEQGRIEILHRVGEIRGLLINLLS